MIEDEIDNLASAIERARGRGKLLTQEFRLKPKEEQIEDIAGIIFFKLYGGYMGQFYYDDLPETEKGSCPEHDGEKWRHSKQAYREVADFILKIWGPE